MRSARWIASAVIVSLVIYSASKVNWHAAERILVTAALAPLVVAIGINLVSVALRGVRWWVFLRRVGLVPLSTSVYGAIVGSGFNNILVANGGDAARAMLIARATGISGPTVVATLALDRLFDPICFGLLLFTSTFFLALPHQRAAARAIACAVLLGLAALLVCLVRSPPGSPVSTDVSGWRGHLRVFRQQVAFLSTTSRFTLALLISAVIWTLQITVFALVAKSVRAGLPVAGSVAALLLTNTGLVFRATPGNIGYFQFAYGAATAGFGITTETAMAAALLVQLVQIVPTTLTALALAPRLSRRNSSYRDIGRRVSKVRDW